MHTLSDYVRRAAARFPNAKIPRRRRLLELAQDGAPWAEKNSSGYFIVVDEGAADRALGLTAPATVARAA